MNYRRGDFRSEYRVEKTDEYGRWSSEKNFEGKITLAVRSHSGHWHMKRVADDKDATYQELREAVDSCEKCQDKE